MKKQYRHNKQNRERGRVARPRIVCGLVALALLGFAILDDPRAQPARSRGVAAGPSAHVALEERIEESRREIEDLVRDAELILRDFEGGENVLDFYKEHAIPAIVDGPPGRRVLRTLPRQLSPSAFFVVVLDQQEADRVMGGNALAGFSVVKRTLTLSRLPFISSWRGFVIAHELFHALEGMTGTWRPTYPASDESVAGEVRAHAFESRVIDHWTRGAFSREIDLLSRRMEPLGFPRLSTEDCRDLDALFPPPASGMEQDARRLVYRLAGIFRAVDRSGTPDGFHRKMEAYRLITGLTVPN